MDTKQAVTKICDEMRADEGYRYGWQANIAMAFVDAVSQAKKTTGKRSLSRRDIHAAANDAADSFLTLLART